MSVKAWVSMAAGVLGLFTSLSQMMEHWSNLEDRRGEVDVVTAHERRLSVARSVLPERGLVGFSSGGPPWENEDWMYGYFRSQYSLAPVVLKFDDEAPLVFVVVENDEDLQGLMRRKGWSLVQKLGDGLALVGKKP